MQELVQKQPEKINFNFKKFEQSTKSEHTKKVYLTCLRKYFELAGSSKIMHSVDSRTIEDHVINFIIFLRIYIPSHRTDGKKDFCSS